MCISKKIFLWRLTRSRSTQIEARISISDFKRLRQIAKKTKCKVEIDGKKGLPFLLYKYKKRKIFAITLIVIAILIFGLTRFIWNIDIKCNEQVDEAHILEILKDNGIKEGTFINGINTSKAINAICLENEDISWVGIKIDGTNIVVSIEKATEKPKIIDNNEICNIVSDKDAVITKITPLNGTARVAVGDTVKPGDLLVEGIIEGKYTGNRYVHSEAKILANVYYNKEEEADLKQKYYETTENTYTNFAIKINNFKINFNKMLPKFKKYDTIETKNKFKLFSNFYLPIEFVKTTYTEENLKYKQYTIEELSDELQQKLKKELLEENNISEENLIDVIPTIETTDTSVLVKLTCVVQEEIGIPQQLVY